MLSTKYSRQRTQERRCLVWDRSVGLMVCDGWRKLLNISLGACLTLQQQIGNMDVRQGRLSDPENVSQNTYRENQKTGSRYRGLYWQQTDDNNWLADLTDCSDLIGWNLYWHRARVTSTLFPDSPCRESISSTERIKNQGWANAGLISISISTNQIKAISHISQLVVIISCLSVMPSIPRPCFLILPVQRIFGCFHVLDTNWDLQFMCI